MASSKQQVRLLLDPATALEINQLAKKESRSVSSVCSLLIGQALYAKRAERLQAAEVQRLVASIRGQADGYPS